MNNSVKFKLKHFSYPQVKLQRTKYRMSNSLQHPKTIIKDGLLTIEPHVHFSAHSPLVVDLHGVLNRITAKGLKSRIRVYLKENMEDIAINFSGITNVEREAVFSFMKKLKGEKERIKMINVDSLQMDIADATKYVKNYFEVFMDIEELKASLV